MPACSNNHTRGAGKTIVIGFDFGTHSTKVVVRERGRVEGFIASFDDACDGYPQLASPSLVRCENDRLYFGAEALRRTGGDLFRSLKVNLLAGVDAGRFASFPLDSSTLVAAYLAWAFQKLRRSLPQYADSRVFLNLAAPMSHVERPQLRDKYLRILQAAWMLSFGDGECEVDQGVALGEARNVIEGLFKSPLEGPESRRFEVLPETIAPVVSLSLDPWMAPGMYMIVDAGAGTTEMAVFHAGGAGADQRVLCYYDETMLLGGNDLRLAERYEGSERMATIEQVVRQMVSHYCRIWQLGYRLDAPNHRSRQRWKQLTLVLSGGGTRHEEVAVRLEGRNPMHPWPDHETHYEICRHAPKTLESPPDMHDLDRSMYAVANGLAIQRMRWPIVFQPHEIAPLPPTEEVLDKPLAYWYLEAK